MKSIIFCIIAMGLIGCSMSGKIHNSPTGDSAVDGMRMAWQLKQDVNTPESVYYDRASDFLFVSNINGEGTAKDGNGFIQKVDLDGNIIDSNWITGLNAPKGMRSHNGVLWVSDIDEVVAIDIAKAKIIRKVQIPKALFLNDIAINEAGVVYVSDTIGSAIYRIKNYKYKTVVRGPQWESPNGLLFKNGKLIVAAWGFTTDWTTKIDGQLYELDLKTKRRKYITEAPLGHLDGLEIFDDGSYLVSDWSAGKVYKIRQTGEVLEILSGYAGSADLAYIPSRRLLVVPVMKESRVLGVQMGPIK